MPSPRGNVAGMRSVLCALGLLLAREGCDKLRNLPGLEPTPAAPLPPPPVAMGPWLLDPVAGRMTVAWVTAEPVVGRVWYGTAEPDRLATEEGKPVREHRVTIGSLHPATQYKYRIEGAPETFLFSSAPEAGAEGPVTFLVYGDNRSNSGDHALVVRAAAAERAQVALHTGDMVASAADADLWRAWFDEERDLLPRTPIVPTVGNHEITDGGAAYSRWFQHPGRPSYWSLDYGPVHLAVLDSFEVRAGATPRTSGMSEAQKAWLEEDLRGVPKERHVWVLVHQGPYAHPAEQRGAGHGGSDAVREAIAAAARVHPIEAVFAGHEHFYERGQIDGQTYFVFGGGGAPLEEPDESAQGVQAARKALSYAAVQVCGCQARGLVKDIAGRVIDSFRLASCDKPCSAPGAAQAEIAAAPPSSAPPAAPEKRVRRRRGRKSPRDGEP